MEFLTHTLMYVHEKSIIWCGSFPNVPLFGSKGCINYIFTLAIRQLSHPLWKKPEESDLEGFILHNENTVESIWKYHVCMGKGTCKKIS